MQMLVSCARFLSQGYQHLVLFLLSNGDHTRACKVDLWIPCHDLGIADVGAQRDAKTRVSRFDRVGLAGAAAVAIAWIIFGEIDLGGTVVGNE
jgi:hypothetical protein